MSLLVQAAPAEHLPWLAERSGCTLTGAARGLEAVDRSGRIRGMVALDAWTETAAQVHVAVEAPIACRRLTAAALRYAFEQSGRRLLLATIRSDNVRALRLATGLGFAVDHRVRGAVASGVDLVLVTLRREDCRWLSEPPARRDDGHSMLEPLGGGRNAWA